MSWDKCPQRCSKDSQFCHLLRDKSLTVSCVRCSEDDRAHSERDEGAQVPRWKSREHACPKISMRQYASSPRKKKSGTRDWRRERLQRITERTSSAPRLASSSAASFPGRNECPGIHCSLVEQEEREDSSCQIFYGV